MAETSLKLVVVCWEEMGSLRLFEQPCADTTCYIISSLAFYTVPYSRLALRGSPGWPMFMYGVALGPRMRALLIETF